MHSVHPRPWRRTALFSLGRRLPLDRNARARFAFLLRAHRRARRLTPAHELVGLALLKRLSVDGRCDPAHATVAEDAGVSDRTVRRATVLMRQLGLLTWTQRLIRSGWRTEQTSNQYVLCPSPVPPALCCGGQVGRETMIKRFIRASASGTTFAQKPPLATPEEVASARAALERRVQEMQEKLLKGVG